MAIAAPTYAQLPVEGPGVADVVTFEKYDENAGGFVLHKTLMRFATVTETTLNPAGAQESRTVLVPEMIVQARVYSLAEAIIGTAGGKTIKGEDAAKQLKKGQAVIVISQGTQLPANLKSLLRDDAIIFEVKDLSSPSKPVGEVPPK